MKLQREQLNIHWHGIQFQTQILKTKKITSVMGGNEIQRGVLIWRLLWRGGRAGGGASERDYASRGAGGFRRVQESSGRGGAAAAAAPVAWLGLLPMGALFEGLSAAAAAPSSQ